MCGIVAYLGPNPARPILLEGLRRLEYRGYDSAGIAVVEDGQIVQTRAVGQVANLAARIEGAGTGTVGIAHTRWATHGGVKEANAHPHLDTEGAIAVVHNGILDNANALRAALEEDGVVFRSETDTEVFAHLISGYYFGDPVVAVQQALKECRGTWGLAVLFADHPDKLLVARYGSPLVVGIEPGKAVVASDAHALAGHAAKALYLEDGEIAVVEAGKVTTARSPAEGRMVTIDDSWVAREHGFEHDMLAEIHEQPEALTRCMAGRLREDGLVRLRGLEDLGGFSPSEVRFLACGTSLNAGRVGAHIVEAIARIPARGEVASEFRSGDPLIRTDGLHVAISQSGETFDTVAAISAVHDRGGRSFGIVNVPGSTLARRCHGGVFLHAGPEVAVASTKAFTSQVMALTLFALGLGDDNARTEATRRDVIASLLEMPAHVEDTLRRFTSSEYMSVQRAVERICAANYAMFIGRGPSWAVAEEGALKLKEIAYVPTDAYAAGEMKHGPIAMLTEGAPVICVVPDDHHRSDTLGNLAEVKARGAWPIVVHTVGDEEAASMASVALASPRVHPLVASILSVLPLQLLAYRAAVTLGHNVDRPRNLAKSVTVA
jgi:glucosamine--fructose-6-phosphate aminotransferase (isomerizing)